MLDTHQPESRPRAHADRYARWAGLAVGVVAAPLWATVDITNYPLSASDAGVPLVSFATAFGLCAVGGVLLGDALTPLPREAVRTASLTPRRIRDHVPPRITLLLLLQAVILVAVVGAGDALGTQDAMHRAIGARGDGCDGTEPPVILWPGILDGRQILGSLAIGTVACAWALRRVARRAGDDQQRHNQSSAIIAAWGVLVSTQLSLVVLTIHTDLMGSNCADMMGISSLAIYLLGLLSLITLAWSLFAVVAPRAARR
ncbi:hypothetical protein [Streptomyces sp. AC550_RSS872]|uniref:hypothetical protein n=1 Tax=Streptomyces sp. AC550_RSS872 TaxID=2823689 RepID=UPI001C268781|nr:hypothetical protein [Streptomyces sp. AC550_RSS872]